MDLGTALTVCGTLMALEMGKLGLQTLLRHARSGGPELDMHGDER